MNKKELILAAAAAAQLDKQDMTRAVEALLGEIAQAMRRENKCILQASAFLRRGCGRAILRITPKPAL